LELSGSIREILKQAIRGPLRGLAWGLRGPFIRQPRLPRNPKSVLFVCRGNICRSPFAEHLARLISSSRGGDLIVGSAGLDAGRAVPPPPEAIEAAATFGVNLAEHLSSMLTQEQVENYHAVFSMEWGQLKELKTGYRQHTDKFFLLPLMGSNINSWGAFEKFNIKDPYGGSVQEFIACYKRIEGMVQSLFSRIS
jgi:protein-tyrosine phosphatase